MCAMSQSSRAPTLSATALSLE
uniref:Uncharacterized protein n=1 Tax=Arundo donax TaxID=35708 RepID=A0A0A9DZ12_ARUDO